MQKEIYSEKLKTYLNKKLEDSQEKIVKIKKKQKLFKGLYVVSIVTSVILSSTAVAVTSLFGLPFVPTIIITVFSTTSAISTTLSSKFNFKGETDKLELMTTHLNKINNKLDYVLSCNGNLTEDEYKAILDEF